MPCYDHRDSPSYIEEHEVQPLKRTNEKLAARVNQYARWLCWMIKDREDPQNQAALPADLAVWAPESVTHCYCPTHGHNGEGNCPTCELMEKGCRECGWADCVCGTLT